ncbi:FtsB family cell division protein [Austwickia chelonae]|uniref:FtsB family cell division protein n=1 Tax=Austwickia chelonae TaxID=100225 RepID=UPI000E22EED3|nr:septum formation initiator family protein [Austwickia chelonae]
MEGQARTNTPEALIKVTGPTRRLAVLGAVLLFLALMLMPTLRAWYEQRHELDAMRAKVASQEQTVRELTEEKGRWEDPAYVEQQARKRLKLVKPGEVAYTVIGADGVDEARQGEIRGSLVAPAQDEQMSWFAKIWASVELTDGIRGGRTRLEGGQPPTPTLNPSTTPMAPASPKQSVPGAGGEESRRQATPSGASRTPAPASTTSGQPAAGEGR